ncbi:MAG: hypothetical protein ACAI44_35340, partial [Candidatus Sericytochromatia bacterium]
MEDEKELPFFLGYIALFLLSFVLAAISAFFAKYNPVGWLLIRITSPLVSMSGGVPTALSPGASVLFINLFWPLTLVPVQLVTMHGLK